MLFFILSSLGAVTNAQESTRHHVLHIYQEALEQPFAESRFKDFLATLPRVDDYYIVEGDIALSEEEVRAYLVGKSEAAGRVTATAELLVNQYNGRRDFYQSPEARNLTYAVDRGSFPNETAYQTILTSLRKAAADWEAACPECRIRFAHVAAQDAAPSSDRVSFIVRYQDASGAYIASSFFPHDPPVRRIVRVDPSYFSSAFDKIGVFRHELGHVLGYRHEHIQGIAGCSYEDKKWVPLTPYDPHSVMHYFCGGGGGLTLELSALDKSAHTKLYALNFIGLQAPPPTMSEKAARTAQLFKDVVGSPFDDARRSAYLKSLPQHEGYYIVEGDLRMTGDEVLSYTVAQSSAPAPVERGAELLVNLYANARDFYRELSQRNLAYAVDRNSFPDEANYKMVVDAMQKATKDWTDACSECQLHFTHLQDQDRSPSQEKVSFTVRYQDVGGDYIAVSFFPHDPPLRRYLDIDPSYFTANFDKVGILRHELGHILGYRHEHIRGVPGCYSEDNKWQPLTPYDPKSVMHYFCGGEGSLKLELTALDREGHHKLYGPASSSATASTGKPVLVVHFEGGDVSSNTLKVLRILNREGVLPMEKHTVSRGETLETILKDHIQLPGYPSSMTVFTRQLNKGIEPSDLRIGAQIRYPNVQLTTYEFGTKLDPVEDRQQINQIQENWKHLYVASQEQSASKLVRVVLKGYEIRLTVEDPKKLSALVKEINSLDSRNIIPYARVGSEKKPAYYGHHDTRSYPKEDVRKFWNERQTLIPTNIQGSLGSLLGMADLPEGWAHPCALGLDCPEVVLIDTPVYPHPDLAGEVLTDSGALSSSDSLISGNQQKIEVENDLQMSEHGTHMAGIIASQDNEFGLVGVHPGVRIYSWDWGQLRDQLDVLAKRISDHEEDATNRGSLQVYVFANDWPSPTDPELRLTDDILSRKLSEEKVLVVAAAGQPDPKTGKAPENLTTSRGFGPMNLGDLENVIVVTACAPCDGDRPRVAPWANYSRDGFVHVAAPGENIPSTAGGGHYATATGTSQATAFVAGLASAMVCYYPRSYERADKIKTRLQITSRPLALYSTSETEAAKLVTGIVDEKLAMLDPTKDWIRRNGQAIEPLSEAFQWQITNINGRDSNLEPISVPLSSVYRIMYKGGKVVIYKKGNSKGDIERIGPLKLSTTEAAKQLFLLAGSPVTIGDFEDLLLSRPHKVQGESQ
ncbi:MAG TPA: S8 family serine peptidase [Thermoanaerobaculia bacterium]|nr:S8 family serine peptidase [Thermoanaerobaculia bacterium]